MNPAVSGALLLLLACMGAAQVRLPAQGIALAIVLALGLAGWARRWTRTPQQFLAFALCSVWPAADAGWPRCLGPRAQIRLS